METVETVEWRHTDTRETSVEKTVIRLQFYVVCVGLIQNISIHEFIQTSLWGGENKQISDYETVTLTWEQATATEDTFSLQLLGKQNGA